jgi:hypothetical protein
MRGSSSGSTCSASGTPGRRGARAGATARVALAAGVALTSCAGGVPSPTVLDARWAQQRWPDATLRTLARGRALYVDKCSGCHSLYAPSDVTAARWPVALDAMAPRANLRPDEHDLILRYLLSTTRGATAAGDHGGGG